jgi:hypothetical protein
MDAISPDIIWKSFKKCGISNAIDGSEDNLFQNDDDDDTDLKCNLHLPVPNQQHSV